MIGVQSHLGQKLQAPCTLVSTLIKETLFSSLLIPLSNCEDKNGMIILKTFWKLKVLYNDLKKIFIKYFLSLSTLLQDTKMGKTAPALSS